MQHDVRGAGTLFIVAATAIDACLLACSLACLPTLLLLLLQPMLMLLLLLRTICKTEQTGNRFLISLERRRAVAAAAGAQSPQRNNNLIFNASTLKSAFKQMQKTKNKLQFV